MKLSEDVREEIKGLMWDLIAEGYHSGGPTENEEIWANTWLNVLERLLSGDKYTDYSINDEFDRIKGA